LSSNVGEAAITSAAAKIGGTDGLMHHGTALWIEISTSESNPLFFAALTCISEIGIIIISMLLWTRL
jgi:hypothetical protein